MGCIEQGPACCLSLATSTSPLASQPQGLVFRPAAFAPGRDYLAWHSAQLSGNCAGACDVELSFSCPPSAAFRAVQPTVRWELPPRLPAKPASSTPSPFAPSPRVTELGTNRYSRTSFQSHGSASNFRLLWDQTAWLEPIGKS